MPFRSPFRPEPAVCERVESGTGSKDSLKSGRDLMTPQTEFEYEAQDRAEVLDETNLVEDGVERATFDEIEDVYDVTAAADDDDDDTFEGEDDDVEFDDADVDEIDDEIDAQRDDEGLDIEREPLAAGSVRMGGVPTDSEQPSDLEGGSSPEDVDDERDPHTERNLDKGLKETFPASDPVSINPGAD